MSEDARTRQLRGTVEGMLGPAWKNYLKPNHIYDALSKTQRAVCMHALCVREKLEIELENGVAEYTAPGNIHRITEIVVPEAWDPIEPIEPENWNRKIEACLSGSQPQYCTILFGEVVFTPTPSTSDVVTLWLSMKPSEGGEDDITASEEPMTPASFDEVLALGAVAKLLLMIPRDARVDPAIGPKEYQKMYQTELETRTGQVSRVQNRNGRRMRDEYRF